MDQSLASVQAVVIAALYDLGTMRRYAGQIACLRRREVPGIEVIRPSGGPDDHTPLLVLPGSYNPPTTAHLALAQASLGVIPDARLFLALGTTIINKEQTERATLLDRLLLLNQIACRSKALGVLLTNRGLYVEQAQALRSAFPKASDLSFVVGFDKIEQIFDARYYQDRDAALKQLFSLASFLVAPRASHEASDIAGLLQQPENRAFAAAVRVLPLPADYRSVASSQIRAALETDPHALATSLLAHALPPESRVFCMETGCYLPTESLPGGEQIDRYGLRAALIARALSFSEREQSTLDLRSLFHLAISNTDVGRWLRRQLAQPEETTSPHDLLTLQ